MKKFLVLGIGNAQVDLLRLLKDNDEFEVHALSNTDQGRGFAYADFFDIIDITDKSQVKAYCVEHGIDVIYSAGSDVAMPTVAYVSEALGLPHFVSYETALSCNSKHIFREKLKHAYGSVPFSIMTSVDDVMDLEYPVIVKPVDSQGQRGVSTAENPAQLKEAFTFAVEYSRAKTVIVEKKIQGIEISVNAYMCDGDVTVFIPSERVSWEGFDGGIIHKHLLPSQLTPTAQANVLKLVKASTQALEITNGPAYFQIKMDGETPYLIEVTPRLDGCHMWRLINTACNVDLLDISVKHLLGESFSIPSIDEIKAACLEFYCQPPHEKVVLPEMSENSLYHELYYSEGDTVKAMNGKMEKCGYHIFLNQ